MRDDIRAFQLAMNSYRQLANRVVRQLLVEAYQKGQQSEELTEEWLSEAIAKLDRPEEYAE